MKKSGNAKSALLGNTIGSVLLILGGLVLLSDPDFGSAAVATVIGWVLIAAGALGLIVSVLSWPVFSVPEILLCLLGLGVGIYLVKNPLSLASILGFVLGAYLVIQGGGSLLECVKLRQNGFGFRPNLVLGAAMLVFGLILIFSPLAASQLIMTLCGLVMVVCGAANLVIRARAAKRLQQGGKDKIIDADE